MLVIYLQKLSSHFSFNIMSVEETLTQNFVVILKRPLLNCYKMLSHTGVLPFPKELKLYRYNHVIKYCFKTFQIRRERRNIYQIQSVKTRGGNKLCYK